MLPQGIDIDQSFVVLQYILLCQNFYFKYKVYINIKKIVLRS